MSRGEVKLISMGFRIPPNEVEILKRYASQENRTYTDLLREHIRSMEKKIKHDPQKRTDLSNV